MMWLAIGVLAGFAVKVPLMPFHTWLPAAYAEAPSPVTMLLTGAMSKMGVYGLLRIALPLFGAADCADAHAAAGAGRGHGRDGRVGRGGAKGFEARLRVLVGESPRLLPAGRSSRSRFPRAGAAAQASQAAALNGVILQMFNHGLTAAALFWFIAMIQERSGGVRGIDDFGGLRKPAPVLAGLMGIALFSSLGLPGLNGFVGEFLIFRGVFPLVVGRGDGFGSRFAGDGGRDSHRDSEGVQRARAGALGEFPDLHHGERLALAPVIGLMFLLGLAAATDCGHREPDGGEPAGALEILDVGLDDLSLVCRCADRGAAAEGQSPRWRDGWRLPWP